MAIRIGRGNCLEIDAAGASAEQLAELCKGGRAPRCLDLALDAGLDRVRSVRTADDDRVLCSVAADPVEGLPQDIGGGDVPQLRDGDGYLFAATDVSSAFGLTGLGVVRSSVIVTSPVLISRGERNSNAKTRTCWLSLSCKIIPGCSFPDSVLPLVSSPSRYGWSNT